MRFEELDSTHEENFLAMLADFAQNDTAHYASFYQRSKPWDPAAFRSFLKDCQKARLDWRPGPGKTSESRYVLLNDQGELCGNGLMRFPLDESTEYEGGNLLFDVPPSKRGHGYGALVLNGLLFEAVRAGMARALVTCPSENRAAIRAIELNRGELESTVLSRRPEQKGLRISRFWIRFR